MNKKWLNKSFIKSDLSKIEELRRSFVDPSRGTWKRSISTDYYHWKLIKNYLNTGILHVAEIEDTVVGMVSITPKSILYKGKKINSGELGDCFINPQHNQKGMFFSLLKSTKDAAHNKGIEFLYGTPNSVALPGERKAGYEIIPSSNIFNLVYPINVSSILSVKTDLEIIRKLLSPIISIYLKFLHLVNCLMFWKPKVAIESISEFPNEIDELFDKCSTNYDWIMERNKFYLDWRFTNNPDEYSMFLVKFDNIIIGYFIIKIGTWQKLKVGYVADYLIDPHYFKTSSSIMQHILSSFDDFNIDMISIWASIDCPFYRIAKKYGFLKFKPIPVICYKNKLGNKIISSDLKWYFTMADSDNI